MYKKFEPKFRYLLNKNNDDILIHNKIKVLVYAQNDIIFRQLPTDLNHNLIEFSTDLSCDDFDFVVFMHHSSILSNIKIDIPRERLIFLSMEPSDRLCKLHYKFLNQFGLIVTSDSGSHFVNKFKFNIATWWVGVNAVIKIKNHGFQYDGLKNFEYFRNNSPHPKEFRSKINRISVIRSSKLLFEGHSIRDKFIDKLIMSEIGQHIDVFGGPGNYIHDKFDAINPYRYHLVVENYVDTDYWSEKLSDVFLCNSFPIYYGCKNIDDYFDSSSILKIDINDFEATIAKLNDLIFNEERDYSRQINESKNLILYNYNIFNVIFEIILGFNKNKLLKNESNTIIYPNIYYLKGKAYYFLKNLWLYIRKLIS